MGGQEENPLKIKGFLVRETGLEYFRAAKRSKTLHNLVEYLYRLRQFSAT